MSLEMMALFEIDLGFNYLIRMENMLKLWDL